MSPPADQHRLLLRPPEAAAALGVSLRTLMAWTAAGKLPHFRQGRCLRFPVDQIRQWVGAHTAAAPEVGQGGAR